MTDLIPTNPHPAAVRVTARTIYGATKFYPSNPTAHGLAAIAKTTTLTVDVLKIAERMGLNVVIDGDKTLADMLALCAA